VVVGVEDQLVGIWRRSLRRKKLKADAERNS
jgi:hypothetical protein